MTKSYVARVLAALGLMLLLAPCGAAAKSGRGGAHHNGFHSHHGRYRLHRHRGFQYRPRFHRGFQYWPLYGGFVSTAPYDSGSLVPYYGAMPPYFGPDYVGGPPQTFVAPPEPPPALHCKRSRTTVTVPSADGGTRKVVVTRC